MSYRQTEKMFGVPKSVMHDNEKYKVKTQVRGKQPVVPAAVEEAIINFVQWISGIGYPLIDEQIIDETAKILNNPELGYKNLFPNGCPSCGWVQCFLHRHWDRISA